MAEEISQASTRAWAEFTDQHGRTWGASTENKTRHPHQPLQPQFYAPFIPFDKYLMVKGTNKVVIDYNAWLRDIDEANRVFDADLRNYAFQLYGQAAAQYIENPTAELLALTGHRPERVPRDFIEAAMDDNQWILGFNPTIPNWAHKHIKAKEEAQAPAPLKSYPDADDEPAHEYAEDTEYESKF